MTWWRSVWVMGGSYLARGNTTALAEFNFQRDPEAAHLVLEAVRRARTAAPDEVAPVHVVPWEVCEDAALDWGLFDRLTSLGSPQATFLKAASAAYEKNSRPSAGIPQPVSAYPLPAGMTRAPAPPSGYLPCDAYCMAALLASEGFLNLEVMDAPATVVVDGATARGTLAITWYNHAGAVENIRLVTSINPQKFFLVMQSALRGKGK